MVNHARPKHGLRQRVSGGLLIAALLAALLAFVPGATASAGEVSKKGTLGDGYFFVATDGGIFNFGDSEFKGSTGDIKLNQPIVGAESTPTGEGYWLVASDGGIFTFGDAEFLGSTGDIKLNKPIVAMVATPTGKGYWLFATDGGVFSFGDAVFYGSTGDIKLNKPIVGADATATGKGYYLVASDGGIFAFGDAEFYGSAGAIPLNKPIVGMAATDDGKGYYLVATDGGIFSYGKTADDAQFFGSEGGSKLNQPIVGMDLSATNQGYYLVAADGGIFTHGDAVFQGSTGNLTLNKPIVGMSVTPNSPIAAPDFVARLSGSKETAGGDTDASGFANLDFTDDEVCWNIKVNNLDTPATAAHIHRGNAGVNGPVVITLKTPDANGTSAGCADLDPALAKEILANPQGFYVNVHNAGFTNGAARGQLKGHTGVGVTATTGTKAKIVVFDTENPASASVLREVELGGPAPVVGIDFRPGTLDAYFLVQSGANTLVLLKSDVAGTTTTIGTVTLANGASAFGMDFNPVVDRIRLITNTGENYRINPDTAELTQDANLPGFPAAGFAGAAYTHNVKAATTTTLYDINPGNDTLYIQGGPDGTPSPNTGAVTPVGALGVDLSNNFGFDIAPGAAGTAIVAGQLAGSPSSVLLAIDLATGKATNIGRLGSAATDAIQAFSMIA
jgi:ribosomal protein L24E